MKIPYEEAPKRRGRKPGSKNQPGHRAGRPSNGNQYGVAAPIAQGTVPTGKDPGRLSSQRIAYDTPGPCTDGHHCPGNGNGQPQICKEPLPNLPAKPIPIPHGNGGVMAAVAQSGENPELITPEALIKEIQRLATSDIRLIPGCPKDIPDEIAPAISSFTIIKTVHTAKDGSTIETEQFKYTLWSKSTAQDQLSRWHGLYAKDKTPINAQFNQFNQMNINNHGWDLSRLSGEELEMMLALASKAEGDVLDLEAVGAR